jgi:hypothetical protein
MLILTKTCSCCGEEKEFTEFSRNKRSKWGFRNKCKSCENIGHRERCSLDREGAAKRSREYYKLNHDLVVEKKRTYREENRELIRSQDKVHSLKRKDSKKEYDVSYRVNNRDKRRSWSSKRRASILRRTPSWLTENNFKQIEAYFSLSERLSNCLGIEFHVDHIIPLQGKLVSGLHTPTNLQVLPATINIRKGNKYE